MDIIYNTYVSHISFIYLIYIYLLCDMGNIINVNETPIGNVGFL